MNIFCIFVGGLLALACFFSRCLSRRVHHAPDPYHRFFAWHRVNRYAAFLYSPPGFLVNVRNRRPCCRTSCEFLATFHVTIFRASRELLCRVTSVFDQRERSRPFPLTRAFVYIYSVYASHCRDIYSHGCRARTTLPILVPFLLILSLFLFFLSFSIRVCVCVFFSFPPFGSWM